MHFAVHSAYQAPYISNYATDVDIEASKPHILDEHINSFYLKSSIIQHRAQDYSLK